MKTIKAFGLLATVAVFAMALFGASTAMGEITALCEADESPCNSLVSHVHYEAENINISTSTIEYNCDALYLAQVQALGSPQILEGAWTYTNCDKGCARQEENGPNVLSLSRTGTETAELVGKGSGIHSECPGSLDCVYSFEGLTGSVKGALLATSGTGEITYVGQTLTHVSGSLCPTAKLSATYVLSSKVYISS